MRQIPSVFCVVTALAGCASEPSVFGPDDLEQATVRTYSIDSATLPSRSSEALAMGFDFGDGTTSNALGLAHAIMSQQLPTFVVEPQLEAALATTTPWALTVFSNPDGTLLGAQLAINGRGDSEYLAFADASHPDAAMVGGSLDLPLGAVSDALGTSDPGWITGVRARIAIDGISDSVVSVRVGAVFDATQLAVLDANLAAFLTSRLDAGTSEFAKTIDTDHDGMVTTAELRANGVIQSSLHPDFERVPELANHAGLSFGFGLHGTR